MGIDRNDGENNKTRNRTRQNGLNYRLGGETLEFYVCVYVCVIDLDRRSFHTYAIDRAAMMRWFFDNRIRELLFLL
jgi:hypothetical protein